MKFRAIRPIVIGDVHAFKKMLADAINNNTAANFPCEEDRSLRKLESTFSYNDQHYQFNDKINIDLADS